MEIANENQGVTFDKIDKKSKFPTKLTFFKKKSIIMLQTFERRWKCFEAWETTSGREIAKK